MFDLTRLSQWGLAFILLVLTLGVVPADLQAQSTPVYIDDSPAAVDQLTEAARLRFRNVPALYVQGAQVPRPFLENEQIVTQVMLEAQERAKN